MARQIAVLTTPASLVFFKGGAKRWGKAQVLSDAPLTLKVSGMRLLLSVSCRSKGFGFVGSEGSRGFEVVAMVSDGQADPLSDTLPDHNSKVGLLCEFPINCFK